MILTSIDQAAHLSRAIQGTLDAGQAARRKLWRERKRAWRFLKSGGTLVREEHGGSVGVRWVSAARSGRVFDVAICERWVARERIAPVLGTLSTYAWVERL